MRQIDRLFLFTAFLAMGLGAVSTSVAQEKAAPATKAEDTKGSQPGDPAASKEHSESLEEALANALKNNPDIRVAESKVHEAEAELNRTRLQVTQKVVSLLRNIEAQKTTIRLGEARLRRFVKIQAQASGAVSSDEIDPIEGFIQTQKAKLAELEADLAYLTGKQAADTKRAVDISVEKGIEFLNARHLVAHQASIVALGHLGQRPVEGQNADKIRKALNTVISYESDDAKLRLGEALKNLEKLGGVTFLVNIKDADLPPVSRFRFTNLPLGAVLQAFEDVIPGLRFTVREYGILVTLKGSTPQDSVRLRDFWKALSTKDKEKGKEEGTKKEGK
jgi:hypothetical protein